MAKHTRVRHLYICTVTVNNKIVYILLDMDKILVLSVCMVVVTAVPVKRYVGEYQGGSDPYQTNRPPGQQYRPSHQHRGRDSGNYPPANYQYKYDVDAPEYGTQFGHQEERQGDVVQGTYYVQLPDGRTQVVEYVADQNGYRPKIRYEGGQGRRGSVGGYGRGGVTGGISGYQGGQGDLRGFGRGAVTSYQGGQGNMGGYERGIVTGYQGSRRDLGGYGRGGVTGYQGPQGNMGGYERGIVKGYQGSQRDFRGYGRGGVTGYQGDQGSQGGYERGARPPY